MFIVQSHALPFGEGAPEGGGRGAIKYFELLQLLANSYCLHASSVMPYGMPPSPEGKAYLLDKLQFIDLLQISM